MEEEKGEVEDEDEVKEEVGRGNVVVKDERVVEMMTDEEVEDGEVRYVSLGRPARKRRSAVIKEKRLKRSMSQRRGKVSALLANWKRMKGGWVVVWRGVEVTFGLDTGFILNLLLNVSVELRVQEGDLKRRKGRDDNSG